MNATILTSIRNSKTCKALSAFMVINIFHSLFMPTISMALTSGPAQEEFASFEPASTSDMVDLYSGDFTYNIPLLSVPGPNGGYPINLAYHSGVGMDQEASWVGLGWNVNVGAINRQLRGLPDDFKGDEVTHTMHLKKSWTAGLDIPKKKYVENFGKPQPTSSSNNPNIQVYYNSYKGMGYRIFKKVSPDLKANVVSFGVGVSYDSQTGLGIEPDLSLRGAAGKVNGEIGISASYNSRQGLQDLAFSSELGAKDKVGKLGKKIKKLSTVGAMGSSSLSFATSYSVPSVQMPMKNTTFPFDARLFGTENTFATFKADFPSSWSGFYTQSEVANDGVVTNKAYGYLYTAESEADKGWMKDFQRENIPYSKKVPYLSPSSFTYDIYNQTGQATGSMFRPYSSSVGILYDAEQTSKDKSKRINAEAGVSASLFHIGAGYTASNGTVRSGSWEDVGNNPDNELESALGFAPDSRADYEPTYFQVYGEKTGILINDAGAGQKEDQLEFWGGDKAYRAKIEKDDDDKWLNSQFVAVNEFITNASAGSSITASADQHYLQQRTRRATNIETLTTLQAKAYGLTHNTGYDGDNLNISKTFDNTKTNQLSEISVLQPDGMRYVYGLPAYNKKQVDATFSVEPEDGDFNSTDVAIPGSSSLDVSGVHNEYLNKTELPAYAHSWLLTAVVSADYVDLTNNGPSDDDFGYWVRFNYKKENFDYKWRVPFSRASFSEGNKHDPMDDRGSYTYGEKEIYYVQSVETKTHIAVFTTSDRKDAVESSGEFENDTPGTGAQGTNTMRKLDKIDLYVKKAYLDGGAVPIKTANFKYTYDLCPGVYNNKGTDALVDVDGNVVSAASPLDINYKRGKLTLAKLYFTYLNSTRGALSPYKFNYGDKDDTAIDNPVYNNRDVDRWGNYKPNSTDYGNNYPYVDFPYTNQDDRAGDNPAPRVDAWSLKKIDLPTGGTINVEYESDDYAYVETQKAGRMFDIISLDQMDPDGPASSGRLDNTLKTADTEPAGADGYRVYFKLETPIPNTGTPEDVFRAKYLDGIDKMYFKIYADLKAQQKESEQDYVTGYAELDKSSNLRYGVAGLNSGNYYIGFVTLKAVDLTRLPGIKVNPFTKASIQHLRINRSELLYTTVPYDNSPLAQVKNLLGSVATCIDDIEASVTGYNTWAFKQDYGKKIYLNGRSVIRLNDPDQKKYGGGVRVSKLTINDNWKNNGGDHKFEYGQEYFYTTTNSTGETISSGVAYEPNVGGDESSLRTPVEYTESIPLGSPSNLFLETPLLAGYYPGASVGYSKITVRSIAPEKAADDMVGGNPNTINKSAAPITIYEFYTPKDFPVTMLPTDKVPDKINRALLVPGISSNYKKRIAESQGYRIELNDMAGKMKALTVRTLPTEDNVAGSIVSQQQYVYNTLGTYDPTHANYLSSKVTVLTSEGNYQTGIIGQSHDIFIDMNENCQRTKSKGLDGNLDCTTSTPPPISVIPLPYKGKNEVSLRTVVTMKVIYRTGILKEVINTNYESVVKTENIAFDIETGEPLLTRVTNEFKEPIYNYTYPAHWFYPGMGGAYKNYGMVFTPVSPTPGSNGDLQIANAFDYFTEGDEVLITFADPAKNSARYTAGMVINGSPDKVHFIDELGHYLADDVASVKIIRSGHRNQQSLSAGNLVAKTCTIPQFNPQDAGTLEPTPVGYTFDNTNDIINASATEYNDYWQTLCGTEELDDICPCAQVNQAVTSVGNMLHILAGANKLDHLAVATLRDASLAYYYGYDAYIDNEIVLSNPMACTSGAITWNATVATDVISADIKCGATTVATFDMTFVNMGHPGTWNDVIDIINVQGDPLIPDPECNGSFDSFTAMAVIFTGGTAYYEPVTGGTGEVIMARCQSSSDPSLCGIVPGTIINPYQRGIKGIWRPKKNYTYVTPRTYQNSIKDDGIFADFTVFNYASPGTNDTTKWVRANTVTKYLPYGFEVENKNAMYLYSAALYGYGNTLNTAVGSNARYRELAFDNFEDYPADCTNEHFRFSAAKVSDEQAHTGKHSLKLAYGETDVFTRELVHESTNCETQRDNYTNEFDTDEYATSECDCIGKFSPMDTTTYVISAWVKETKGMSPPDFNSDTDYTDAKITIEFLDNLNATVGTPVDLSPTGNIIEGWQRVFGTFTVPGSASTADHFTITLSNISSASWTASKIYFDDIRIHPFKGNMTSYVYDPTTLKLQAELDANNYATLYIYDSEGKLTKIKKETIEGIKTIKESRSNTVIRP